MFHDQQTPSKVGVCFAALTQALPESAACNNTCFALAQVLSESVACNTTCFALAQALSESVACNTTCFALAQALSESVACNTTCFALPQALSELTGACNTTLNTLNTIEYSNTQILKYQILNTTYQIESGQRLKTSRTSTTIQNIVFFAPKIFWTILFIEIDSGQRLKTLRTSIFIYSNIKLLSYDTSFLKLQRYQPIKGTEWKW